MRLGLAGLAGLGLRGSALGGAARAGVQGPRYVVIFLLRGGLDAIYGVDPKERAEVDATVDVPYGPDEIVEAGDLLLGPHLATLASQARRMAVLRGVAVRTANHESGALQMIRMKTAVSPSSPGILDIIGSRRDGPPLAAVTIGSVGNQEHTPSTFGAPTASSKNTLLDAMDAATGEDYAILQRATEAHLTEVAGWAPGYERDRAEEHLREVAELFGRMEHVDPFVAQPWPGCDDDCATDLQRTRWLLQNDLTRCVYVRFYLPWDTHFDNARKQHAATGRWLPAYLRFLREMASVRDERGSLLDQTLIVAGSELGRFPRLNGNEGKDHFPETSLMLFGPGLATGEGRGAAYGVTGKMMEGLPLSLETGRPADAGGTRLILDDVGTTLLHMTGFDPELYGYRGRRLRFLEAV